MEQKIRQVPLHLEEVSPRLLDFNPDFSWFWT